MGPSTLYVRHNFRRTASDNCVAAQLTKIDLHRLAFDLTKIKQIPLIVYRALWLIWRLDIVHKLVTEIVTYSLGDPTQQREHKGVLIMAGVAMLKYTQLKRKVVKVWHDPGLLVRRPRDYISWKIRINNPLIGGLVEALGNRVKMDGLTYSVKSPNISRRHKSILAFGLHEIEERILIKKWLPRQHSVIELGGGLGVISCLTNRKLQDGVKHIVVEANPYMLPVLERNRDLNRCSFNVINKAISNAGTEIMLPIDPSFVGSNVAAVGESIGSMMVPTVTLKSLVDSEGIDKFSLIADIEGAEDAVICEDLPQLGDRVRFAMFELHPYVLGADRTEYLMKRMEEMGFILQERIGGGEVFCVAYCR